ncbi:hypothetical protein [Viridibacillus arvi]|uniref:hypothetical protein n=1 Tax=Viridibacillus arvi TaxID=263475 RepID=UPI0034CFA8C9
MKEQVITALQQTKEDAQYYVYTFTPEGMFRYSKEPKAFVENLVKQCDSVSVNPKLNDVLMIGNNIGVSIKSFEENIYYETERTEGFIEYVSKYNPYYKIFINLDKEAKTIEFKLGSKSKLLELVEEGFSGYVSKLYKHKYLRCCDANHLEEHIFDESWNPRMVEIGRKVLQIKPVINIKAVKQ